MNIINSVEHIVKWQVVIDATTDLTGIPDGIYPYNGLGTDQWAVVVNETQIAWGRDYGAVCVVYAEALQTRREHAERCPSDIPFMGEPVPYQSEADDYAVEVTL